MSSTDSDRAIARSYEGQFLGSLTTDEIASVEKCIEDGLVVRSYEGVGGFLGLATVRNSPERPAQGGGGGGEMTVRELVFERWSSENEDRNVLMGVRLPDGSKITVLDRLTGWGDGNVRDIETGYRAPDGRFWLSAGNFDIRRKGDVTMDEAIRLIQENANICVGE